MNTSDMQNPMMESGTHISLKIEDYNKLLTEIYVLKAENNRLKKLDESVKSKIAILKQQKNIESTQTGQFTFLDAQIKFLESLYE